MLVSIKAGRLPSCETMASRTRFRRVDCGWGDRPPWRLLEKDMLRRMDESERLQKRGYTVSTGDATQLPNAFTT